MSTSGLSLPGFDSLLSEIPNMLGFVPVDSIVLIGVRDSEGKSVVLLTLRSDLPPAELRVETADYLREVMRDRGADVVAAMIVGGDYDEQRPLVDELGTALQSSGIALHAVWTREHRAGYHWHCYQDDDCQGPLHDTSTSQLAAATAAAGFRTWESREEMAAVVAAVPDAERDEWAQQLQEWRTRSGRAGGSLRAASEPVFTALEQLRAGEELTVEQGVAALGALQSPLVRDLMLVRQEPSAEHLWTILLRHAPDREVEAPAVLLATAAQLHGDGAMASIALQRAYDAANLASPSNLVLMLDRMLKFPPHDLRKLLDELAANPEFQLS